MAAMTGVLSREILVNLIMIVIIGQTMTMSASNFPIKIKMILKICKKKLKARKLLLSAVNQTKVTTEIT